MAALGSWIVSASVKSNHSPRACCAPWCSAHGLPTQPAGSGLAVDQPHARIFGGNARDDSSGVVVRTIVNDDHFEMRIILCEQRAHALLDLPRLVARRHDDAQLGRNLAAGAPVRSPQCERNGNDETAKCEREIDEDQQRDDRHKH